MDKLRKNQVLVSKIYSVSKDGKFEYNYWDRMGCPGRKRPECVYVELEHRFKEWNRKNGTGKEMYLGMCHDMYVTEDLYIAQFKVIRGTNKYNFLMDEGFEETNDF